MRIAILVILVALIAGGAYWWSVHDESLVLTVDSVTYSNGVSTATAHTRKVAYELRCTDTPEEKCSKIYANERLGFGAFGNGRMTFDGQPNSLAWNIASERAR